MFPATVDSNQPLPIPPISESLPSEAERILEECVRFRVILIGNSGVGKSSLVRHMFNVDPGEIDIAHDRAGKADITKEWASSKNPRFILHDSKGFEAGSRGNWDEVEAFLHRSQEHSELSRRVHAIWLCLETPRKGGRLLQTGDERLLKLAHKLHIPIIVFTKYDLLVNQYLIAARRAKGAKSGNPQLQASESFDASVADLQNEWKALTSSEADVPWVKMSTSAKSTNAKVMGEMFVELTNVTRRNLHDVEHKLWPLWAAAQQVNARQKVELSIHVGAQRYWKDLASSTVFHGQTLIDCIHRIHDDIVLVWNFNDPSKILSSPEFITAMIKLAGLSDEDSLNQASSLGDGISVVSDFVTIAQAGAAALASPASMVGLTVLAGQFLYGKYQQLTLTAKVLATYIVNLVVFLYEIFWEILPSDPPRPLTRQRVIDALRGWRSPNAFDDINFASGVAFTPENIGRAIYTHLRLT